MKTLMVRNVSWGPLQGGTGTRNTQQRSLITSRVNCLYTESKEPAEYTSNVFPLVNRANSFKSFKPARSRGSFLFKPNAIE